MPTVSSPARLATGKLLCLYADIEGSTRRAEQQPQAMRAAQARHDELIRQAVATHGGGVFRTAGDGFCTVFASAPDAVAAALAAQRALQVMPWGAVGELQVRMAIHTGAAGRK